MKRLNLSDMRDRVVENSETYAVTETAADDASLSKQLRDLPQPERRETAPPPLENRVEAPAEPQSETETAAEAPKESGIKAPPGRISPQLQQLLTADAGEMLREIDGKWATCKRLLEEMRGLKGNAFLANKEAFDKAFRQCKLRMDEYIKARFLNLAVGMTSKEQLNFMAQDHTYKKKQMAQAVVERLLTFDSNDLEEIYRNLGDVNRLKSDI